MHVDNYFVICLLLEVMSAVITIANLDGVGVCMSVICNILQSKDTSGCHGEITFIFLERWVCSIAL